jgi:hypothetical protein
MRVRLSIAGLREIGHNISERTSYRCSIVWFGLAAALCLSCGYDPNPTPGRQECSSRTQDCPEDYVCRSGYCWLTGVNSSTSAPAGSSGSSGGSSGTSVAKCTPSCGARVCGANNCGGSCGTCKTGTSCVQGSCVASCQSGCQVGSVCCGGVYCAGNCIGTPCC